MTHLTPAGARKIAHKTAPVTAYVYERGTVFLALAYVGRAARPAFHYQFKTETSRAKYVERFIADQAAAIERRAAEKAKRQAEAAVPNRLKVGDVLRSTWGHEQTNVDFYQVVAVTAKTATFRPIGFAQVSGDGWAGQVVPEVGAFTGPSRIAKVTFGESVRVSSYAVASLWDGQPVSFTAYA